MNKIVLALLVVMSVAVTSLGGCFACLNMPFQQLRCIP
jgi:hypothetical protein